MSYLKKQFEADSKTSTSLKFSKPEARLFARLPDYEAVTLPRSALFPGVSNATAVISHRVELLREQLCDRKVCAEMPPPLIGFLKEVQAGRHAKTLSSHPDVPIVFTWRTWDHAGVHLPKWFRDHEHNVTWAAVISRPPQRLAYFSSATTQTRTVGCTSTAWLPHKIAEPIYLGNTQRLQTPSEKDPMTWNYILWALWRERLFGHRASLQDQISDAIADPDVPLTQRFFDMESHLILGIKALDWRRRSAPFLNGITASTVRVLEDIAEKAELCPKLRIDRVSLRTMLLEVREARLIQNVVPMTFAQDTARNCRV